MCYCAWLTWAGHIYFPLQAVAESAVSEGGVGLPSTEQQLSRLRSALQGMTIYLERACCLLLGVVLPQVSLGSFSRLILIPIALSPGGGAWEQGLIPLCCGAYPLGCGSLHLPVWSLPSLVLSLCVQLMPEGTAGLLKLSVDLAAILGKLRICSVHGST